jgi:hypothetical protein
VELNLKVVGVLLIALALLHLAFPNYFKWKQEMEAISLINKQMMYVHTFFIALVLLMMGVLCLTSAEEIVQTSLGKKLAIGLGVFWLVRLGVQFFGYSSTLWRGKRLETSIHILFIALWTYLSYTFLAIPLM